VTIYLIRHAHAGSRHQWNGDDFKRPLSDKGRRDAERLGELLGDEPIARIFSSPATRCVETVEPLAAARAVPVTTETIFAEGADAGPAIARLLDHAGDNPALCSHGDLVPTMIRHLKASGMRTTDPTESAKGSVWILEVEGDAVVRGTYHRPR
jgi:8-oxo-dGTP diphosphatase